MLDGWRATTAERFRDHGGGRIRQDQRFVSPCGRTFRSKVEVARFLGLEAEPPALTPTLNLTLTLSLTLTLNLTLSLTLSLTLTLTLTLTRCGHTRGGSRGPHRAWPHEHLRRLAEGAAGARG